MNPVAAHSEPVLAIALPGTLDGSLGTNRVSGEQGPRLIERDEQHYERSRWLIRLLYHAALRVSEAAHATAADFYQRRGKWWLHVVGKGGIDGEVPLTSKMSGGTAQTIRTVPAEFVPPPQDRPA